MAAVGLLTACAAGAPPATSLPPTYARLYALEGRVASLTAQHRLEPARAVALDRRLRVAKAELDGGLTPEAEADLAAVEAALQ